MKLRLVKSSDASKQYCFKNTGNSKLIWCLKTTVMLQSKFFQNNPDDSKQYWCFSTILMLWNFKMKLKLVKSSDASKQYCFKNTGNSKQIWCFKTTLMLQSKFFQYNPDDSKQNWCFKADLILLNNGNASKQFKWLEINYTKQYWSFKVW